MKQLFAKRLKLFFLAAMLSVIICEPCSAQHLRNLQRSITNYVSCAKQFAVIAFRPSSSTVEANRFALRTDLSSRLLNYGRHPRNGGPDPRVADYFNRNLARFKYVVENANGSQLFHGSDSASLMGFASKAPSGLVPSGTLTEQGLVPFGGEMLNGALWKNSVNQRSISTTSFPDLENAIGYAFRGESKGWNPEEATREIGFIERQLDPGLIGPRQIDLQKKRITRWSTLSADEKRLVQEGFPVLYGISPDAGKKLAWGGMETASGQKEILVDGGAGTTEVKVIFVPANRVSFVRKLLGSHDAEIRVVPIDFIPIQRD